MTEPSTKTFSIVPSLLVPFTGLPIPTTLDRAGRLSLIISNLTAHHSTVRSQIVRSVLLRHDALVAAAEAEIASLSTLPYSTKAALECLREAQSREHDASIRQMRDNFKATALKDPKDATWRLKVEDFDSPPMRSEEDVEMGGTDSLPKMRTEQDIRTELAEKLLELVELADKETEAYEKHARCSMAGYEKSLKRTESVGGVSGQSSPAQKVGLGGTVAGKGPGVMNPDEQRGVRRMSNGIPVMGSTPRRAGSMSIQEVARR